MVVPLIGTKAGQEQGIQRVHYTHDAMVDLILAHPEMSQKELAAYFGYTEGWVSRVIGSDAFQARLAARKEEVVNPEIRQTLEERIKGLAFQSLEVVAKKLELTGNPELAIKALQLTTTALGMGARVQNATQVNTYVVAMPAKAENEAEWAAQAQAQARLAHEKSANGAPVLDVESRTVTVHATPAS